ncbi:hypothetical protein [Actinomadura sp. HBU206391]|uniref:hypothetical protein n=1 Tax=Actinomadura sp. HBU206391 TaxID=2731692 RepID=UPI0016508853|nr:hypothetical protein [Actinomadura sp. HBU206391]MBC6457760.1 hypothetical protein [Actinomadura sp. HBU206391]
MSVARAVAWGALVMLLALVLLLVLTLALVVAAPDAVLGDGFSWTAGIGGTAVITASAAAAGRISAGRLPLDVPRLPWALLGPVAAATLLAGLPAAAQGSWGGAVLYEVATLGGATIGALTVGSRSRAGR